jgi:hypothetical protein
MLPGVILFGFGLALTVAPLTAAILGAAGSAHSGVASGINNAVARVAGLVAIAVVGAVVAGHFSSHVQAELTHRGEAPAYRAAVDRAASATLEVRPPSGLAPAQGPRVSSALRSASVDSLHLALLISAVLALLSGVLSLLGIRNPPREVSAAASPGGAICGACSDLGEPQRQPLPHPRPQPTLS